MTRQLCFLLCYGQTRAVVSMTENGTRKTFAHRASQWMIPVIQVSYATSAFSLSQSVVGQGCVIKHDLWMTRTEIFLHLSWRSADWGSGRQVAQTGHKRKNCAPDLGIKTRETSDKVC